MRPDVVHCDDQEAHHADERSRAHPEEPKQQLMVQHRGETRKLSTFG